MFYWSRVLLLANVRIGGPYRVRVPRIVPAGEAIGRVEAPRGELFYYVKSNGTAYPERVKVRTPTFANILAFVKIAEGINIADVPASFISLDPCFSCTRARGGKAN